MSDYIIVGAGSAGCVLANRLSENASVTLIEAGPHNHSLDFRLHMPAALSELLKSDRYNWAYQSAPEPGLGDRELYCPRGRVMGGSSSINGMIFVRGNPQDFERWSEQYGLTDWGYSSCLPFFKRSETAPFGDPVYRGQTGPLSISRGELANPLFAAWLSAGEQAGFPSTSDFNGEQQEGVGPFDRSIYRGERQSTAHSYIKPVRQREQLHIMTNVVTTRVIFSAGKATGVEILRGGKRSVLQAGKEVIVCAGAINSPQLLMLSGIGDEKALAPLGIRTVVHSADVGQHLQDHLEVYVQYACNSPVSIYPSTRWYRKPLVGLQWLISRTGDGATNHFEAGAFLQSGLGVSYPDLQYHFLPVAMDYDGKDQFAGHGFQLHVGPMKPTSRGSIRLRSADPMVSPDIRFNYASTALDREVMQRGIEIGREIVHQSAFDEFRGAEIRPGPARPGPARSVAGVRQSADLDAFVRHHGESAYHPCGTCRMGADEDSVVDSEGRVRGVSNLRVVDASIMPEITNGNLNAVVIMMAEKIADGIST